MDDEYGILALKEVINLNEETFYGGDRAELVMVRRLGELYQFQIYYLIGS